MLFQGSLGPLLHILLLHLGVNDLSLKGKALIWQSPNDLRVIQEHWPSTLIVWSAILPRLGWHGVVDPMAIGVKPIKN